MKKDINISKTEIAEKEYQRLVSLYREAGADETRLFVNDELIRKVAEVFSCLESIKNLPSIVFDKKNPAVQRETPAGKMRVKYMAQYVSAMQKLNKELLGSLSGDDDEMLEEYE